MSGLFEHGRFAFAVILAVLVLSAPAAALAQTRSQDVPVVVMGVDGRETLLRTHALFQSIIAEVKGIMSGAGHLPLMALEVDAPAVMQLLRMPEVVSVQRDHPVTSID